MYDGDGKRVKKCSNAGCTSGTLYWTGMGSDALYETGVGGAGKEDYIFFNGKRVARRDAVGGAVHYYFSDHPLFGGKICNHTVLGHSEKGRLLVEAMDGESSTVPAASGEGSASLVVRIRAGDRSAEEELVNTYRRGVLLIAGVRTRDREAARDLAQEVLMAVLKALREGQLREPDKLAAFVQGTARNLINNYLRTRARRLECDLDSLEVAGADPVAEFESAERQRLLRRELASFNTTDQQILLLSLVDGHSLAEVARRLGLSHEAVRARKSRMLKKIMQKFGRVSQK